MNITVGKRYQARFCMQDVTGPITELLDDGRVIMASEQHDNAPMMVMEYEIVRELPADTPAQAEAKS